MKLSNRQTDTLIAALRFWQDEARGQITADTCTNEEVDVLCELLSTRDVWVVPPNSIEQLKEYFTKLDELHAKLKDTTNQYIAQVQMKCQHVWQWRGAFDRVCRNCGKERKSK